MKTLRRLRFTLVEFQIALVIMLMLVLAIFTVLGALSSHWSESELRLKEDRQLSFMRRFLLESSANMFDYKWKDANGEQQPGFEGFDSELRFCMRQKRVDAKDGGLRFCHLYLDKDGLLLLEYSPAPLESERGKELMQRDILARDVTSLELRYSYIKRGEMLWLEDWNGNEEQQGLPTALWLTLSFSEGETRDFIQRCAFNGIYESTSQ